MSEYQYYEFQAIDRPLTAKEMKTLRSYSTRARITPTSFVNHYDWGDFKGDEDAWMQKYFDAFLYVANWGTRVFKLRLSAKAFPPTVARQYCPDGSASIREKAGKTIITFVSENEPEDDWDTGEGWLASLLPVRSEIIRGDLRALYLGWLLCVQSDELKDTGREPLVPPGLNNLSASLRSLAEFLRIDNHLLATAAAASGDADDESGKRKALAQWVSGLPQKEKDKMLVASMVGEGARVSDDLLTRFQRERQRCNSDVVSADQPRRTVGDLLRGASEYRLIAAEKAAEEHARRERKAMAARGKYLDGLVGRESALWAKVEKLLADKQPKSYDQALELLQDLRDLAVRKGGGDFRRRLDALRAMHTRKTTFIDMLKKAGL